MKNPKSGHYVKIDRSAGKIISHKKTVGPYKSPNVAVPSDFIRTEHVEFNADFRSDFSRYLDSLGIGPNTMNLSPINLTGIRSSQSTT